MSSEQLPSPTLWHALTHGRTLFTLVMFTIFTVMVAIAAGYPDAARLLPLVIGIPGVALTGLQIVLDVRDYLAVGGKVDPRTDFEIYMDEINERTGGKVEMGIAEGARLQTLVEDPSLAGRGRRGARRCCSSTSSS